MLGVTTQQVGPQPTYKTTTDAGHGANGDGGAAGAEKSTEAEYALKIEAETDRQLKLFGVENCPTRLGPIQVAKKPKLAMVNFRYKTANDQGADVFVSFHLNGGTDD